jgi:L-rhamnose mutarotase|tara:strand:+ start:776 stop:937 length:162 start_codon:yes stop_codon:yes gene_type:complete
MEQIIGFIFLMFALIGVFAVLAAVINRPATRTWWREVLDVMAMNFGQARNRDE